MESFDLATVFWLVALGMIVGAAAKLVLRNKGLDLVPNVVAGVFGTVTVGAIGIFVQIPGSMFFALLGSISVLFLANVFNMHSDESTEHPA